MRLRSPTPLDWDTDPLPDDFELIADADHNHEMHEVVDASNHAAVRLLAEGWVRLPDRDEKTKALIIARLEEAEAEGELDMPAEQARAEGRDLETLVARMRERLLSTEFDKKFDAGEDISDAVDWSESQRPNSDEKFASAFSRARGTVPDEIALGISDEDADEDQD